MLHSILGVWKWNILHIIIIKVHHGRIEQKNRDNSFKYWHIGLTTLDFRQNVE